MAGPYKQAPAYWPMTMYWQAPISWPQPTGPWRWQIDRYLLWRLWRLSSQSTSSRQLVIAVSHRFISTCGVESLCSLVTNSHASGALIHGGGRRVANMVNALVMKLWFETQINIYLYRDYYILHIIGRYPWQHAYISWNIRICTCICIMSYSIALLYHSILVFIRHLCLFTISKGAFRFHGQRRNKHITKFLFLLWGDHVHIKYDCVARKTILVVISLRTFSAVIG